MTIKEGDLLWSPTQEQIATSNDVRFMNWLREKNIADFTSYQQLWQWSVDDIEGFWAALWDYFDIISDTPYEKVIDTLEINPNNKWFVGSKVNFAEHILRNEQADVVALYYLSETRPLTEMKWQELASKVRILATEMRKMGIKPNDAVCCVMPNIPETVIAMLAAISIGALWSNAAPEFGTKTILDRFTQIKPKWIFLSDGYQFGGKPFERSAENKQIIEALSDSLTQAIILPYLHETVEELPNNGILWDALFTGEDPGKEHFTFERVAHDHPLWVLFSSGTTGLPKAIVHSHIGALLEISKLMHFHMNLTEESTSFFYTTTGWMMFNISVGMMLPGAKAVYYDGHPAYPTQDVLWKMAADVDATLFGASPTYVQLMEKLKIVPKDLFNFDKLASVICTGSPSTPETFEWFYKNVKQDLWLTSQSGGTEIVSGFVGSSITLPVHAGEIQCRMLGMDIDSWSDSGESLVDEVGELVCKKPFPSMPIHFLNDPDNKRYNAAYFEDFPGVWRHGDFIKLNQRGGAYIYGRSDSTLNRYGVRIGTSELYRTVERLPEIEDSLVVCVELPGGKFFMPMFVQLAEQKTMTAELKTKMIATLREDCSPRHVPDQFYVIPEIPYTLTGKKMEVPVRKLLLGWPQEKCVSKDVMKNPQAIDFFLDYVENTQDYDVPEYK